MLVYNKVYPVFYEGEDQPTIFLDIRVTDKNIPSDDDNAPLYCLVDKDGNKEFLDIALIEMPEKPIKLYDNGHGGLMCETDFFGNVEYGTYKFYLFKSDPETGETVQIIPDPKTGDILIIDDQQGDSEEEAPI